MIGKLKAMAVAAAALCGLASMSASAEWLAAGQQLTAGQSLLGHDGRYTAIMQGDGNFVVYRISDGVAIWNTGTAGSGADHIVMQGDGNLVIYTADGRAVWWTGSAANAGLQNAFTVDDQGMAAVVSYVPVWVTNTVTAGGAPAAAPLMFQYGYRFQPGVVYNGPNGNQWTFQTDGNLVLYHNGKAVWASNVTTAHHGPAIYAVFEELLTTWNDSGVVWQGANNWSYPAGFTQDPGGTNYPLKLGADVAYFSIQADGNAAVWRGARKWGAPVYDPAPSNLPPGTGPHCIGNPQDHQCDGGFSPGPWGPTFGF